MSILRFPDEAQFEANTIERLKNLGYAHDDGIALRERDEFPLEQVVRADLLERHLKARYPHLPDEAIARAIQIGTHPEGVTLLHRNKNFHELLTRGFNLRYKLPSPDGRGVGGEGQDQDEHIYLVNWDEPTKNDFRVVSQLPIRGQNDRRPDLLIYINGLPLVLFELKNPYDESPTVEGAHNQIQHYTVDIPQTFETNAFCVISDGAQTLHGMFSAELEWFAPWKTIDGREVEAITTGSMKTLIEGLFPKERLLNYIRHFIVFEVVNDVITKKGAKYHQYFGVNFAVEEALRATKPEGDRRIGVIWHTQGSGKSLSMVFFVGILRRRLNNPSFVIQVDRTDLDNQLYDNFVAARSLVGDVKQAESVDDLRELLRTAGGEIIFTTIEKFRLTQGERKHPKLTDRRNIIVIADEAHRTQYGFEARLLRDQETNELYSAYGFAKYLRDALPNASFIGFTGTPIDLTDRDTQAVFGNVIHTYDIRQARVDQAVVPIYYEPRLIKQHLVNDKIDQELQEISESEEQQNAADVARMSWADLEKIAGTKARLQELAQDIVTHFEERTQTLQGKGMIVCMSRRICVALFDEIIARRPEWYARPDDAGQIKIVMTGDLSKDPTAWNEAGHITTKERREKIKARLKNIDDPLKLVIVRDMWLTGTDIPALHTLYVDKPMKGHNLMQAVARVNRIFRDKPGGVVVDYIGIGSALKEAARKYTSQGYGEPLEDLDDAARETFLIELEHIRALLPEGVTVSHWRALDNLALEDLAARLYGHFIEPDDVRDAFLDAEKRLSSAFALVAHLDDCRAFGDEVAFYQLVRAELNKARPKQEGKAAHAQAVQDLINRSIAAQGALDIYKLAGIANPDISILDDEFLEEYKHHKIENVRLKLLEKLLLDEIFARQRTNLRKYRSLQEALEEALQKYHNNTLTAAEVVRQMIEIRNQMREADRRKSELSLSDEELAFYDSIAGFGEEHVFDVPYLAELTREIVQAVKRNLKVDWTKPHRQDVEAEIRAQVKNVLRRRGVRAEQFQFILARVMKQAEALYQDYPMAA
jgi:type I restriction enzyme R subunit